MLTITFSQLTKNDAHVAGGKGASLGEMTRAGIPVPPGFVVTAEAFEQFLKETHLNAELDAILDKVNHADMASVEHASEQIQSLIHNAKMPDEIAAQAKRSFKELGAKFVAVRSSATAEDSASAAWAGQLDSFLNTTEGTLLESIQRCWASLFTPRAVFYRFEKGLHGTPISVAVVVQKMVESEISGVAFSVHPITEDGNQLLIEAGYGLGEAIVSGEITPDSYVVEKNPRRIIDVSISEQKNGIFRKSEEGGNEWCDIDPKKRSDQKLSEENILTLSTIILSIENHYGFPCDVEWGWENGKFFIVQSRPITTLSGKSSQTPAIKLEFTKMWESLAFVFNVDQGTVRPTLYALPRIASFADQHWFFYCKNRGVGGAYYEEGEMKKAKSAGLKDFLNDNYRENYFNKADQVLEKSRSPLQKIESVDFTQLSNAELQKLISDASEYLAEVFAYYLASQQQCTVGIEEKMQDEVAAFVPKDKIVEVFTLLSTPTTITTIREEEIAWLKLLLHAKEKKLAENDSEVEKALHLHYDKYHLVHLGDGEVPHNMQYYAQKFTQESAISARELQTKLEYIIKAGEMIEAQKKEAIKAYRIPAEIEKLGNILAHIGHIRLEMRIRGWMPVVYFSQDLVKEAGKRFGISEEIILSATQEEIDALFASGTIDTAILEERNKSYLYMIENGVAKVHAGDEADAIFLSVTAEENFSDLKEIKGNVAMKGKVTGTVTLFKWGEDISAKLETMNEHSILVAGQTRPQLMPLIAKSRGIITDEGGITSHAAIVSRELRIPCIIGTKIGTQVLKDGDLIELDGEKGVIRILKAAVA